MNNAAGVMKVLECIRKLENYKSNVVALQALCTNDVVEIVLHAVCHDVELCGIGGVREEERVEVSDYCGVGNVLKNN